MEKKWEIQLDEYQGNFFVKIWALNKSGKRFDEKPTISLGKTKFLAIMDNWEEIAKLLKIDLGPPVESTFDSNVRKPEGQVLDDVPEADLPF